MDKHFDDAQVTGYEPLIETVDLPDAGDRHVLAAAIQCGAEYIVTDNLADFPNLTMMPTMRCTRGDMGNLI